MRILTRIRLATQHLRQALLLFALSGWLIAGSAQQTGPWGLPGSSTQPQVEEALNILARLPALQSAELDAALLRMGFDTTPPFWTGYSPKGKLEYAYRWAQAVSDANGQAFIHSLARQFEQRFESLRFDRVFQLAFIAGSSADQLSKVTFLRPTPTQLSAPLPQDIQSVLNRLSRYVEGPGFLGRYSIAIRRFGLKGQQLDDTLEAKDPQTFLHEAARRASPPPPIHERVNALMQDVLIASESASFDAELAKIAKQIQNRYGTPPERQVVGAYIDKDGHVRTEEARMKQNVAPFDANDFGDAGPQTPTPTPSSGGGGGGSPERARTAADLHQRFEAKSYSSPSSRTFRASVRRAGGRGGVIAGAPVSTSLGRLLSIQMEIPAGAVCEAPGKPRVKGSLLVRTTGSTSYRMDEIDCDVLVAAKRSVFDSFGSVPWTDGQAIGLASIDTAKLIKAFPYFLPTDGDLSQLGKRKRMILHPALLDLDVGRSISFLDLWPSASFALMQSVGDNAEVAEWLKNLKENQTTTWKWIDTPANVTASGPFLKVVPIGRSQMLSFRGFTRDEMLNEALTCKKEDPESLARCRALVEQGDAGLESTSFDSAAPKLIASNRDFAKAEQFMRVLSVFKLARKHGVQTVGGDIPLAVPRARTPTYIIVGNSRSYIAAGYNGRSWKSACEEFQRNFSAAFEASTPDERRIYKDDLIDLTLQLMQIGVLRKDGSFNCS